uniref:Uncharacterized protein n=1 Tax=Panagrolaimus sp. ES5 TaxID=591445 RepID=A0AC34FE53_9BILA
MDVEEEPSDLEKPIEMVVFDDQSHIYYGGTCQVFLNVDTNTLLVKPVNKELQIFSTSFESYFITEQNIIYVESSLECIKFALIFPEPIFAQNLYKIVVTHRQMVQPKNYKIVKYQKDNQVQQKLFIFNAQDRNFAHAFKWNDRKMLFECLRCQDKTMTKIVTAAIKTDNFGEEFIYLNTDTHSCRVQRYEEVENVF